MEGSVLGRRVRRPPEPTPPLKKNPLDSPGAAGVPSTSAIAWQPRRSSDIGETEPRSKKRAKEKRKYGNTAFVTNLIVAPQGEMEPELGETPSEDWWMDAMEIDTMHTMSLEGEGGPWSSAFVPPPPRPEFLDDDIASDGVTTCDLCTWARHHPTGPESLGGRELSWVMTLIIVSLLSALIGAVVMITVIKCRNRLKHLGHTTGACFCLDRDEERDAPSIRMTNRSTSRASNKELENNYHLPHERREGSEDRRQYRVWSWLSRRSPLAPSQLGSSAPTAPDNHYTVEEVYPSNGEALYAELDRASSNSPAYQNTAYTGSDVDTDCPPSSAPSSAYYSDLSCAPSDRTYEAVGPPEAVTFWDNRRFPPQLRLSSIHETITVPSDYV